MSDYEDFDENDAADDDNFGDDFGAFDRAGFALLGDTSDKRFKLAKDPRNTSEYTILLSNIYNQLKDELQFLRNTINNQLLEDLAKKIPLPGYKNPTALILAYYSLNSPEKMTQVLDNLHKIKDLSYINPLLKVAPLDILRYKTLLQKVLHS